MQHNFTPDELDTLYSALHYVLQDEPGIMDVYGVELIDKCKALAAKFN